MQPDPIQEELRARSESEHLLSPLQYELLRLRGKTQEEVEEFEAELEDEIKQQRGGNPLFISTWWVERRCEGFEPDEIQYDWVHAFR